MIVRRRPLAVVVGHTNQTTDPRVLKSIEALWLAGFRTSYLNLSTQVAGKDRLGSLLRAMRPTIAYLRARGKISLIFLLPPLSAAAGHLLFSEAFVGFMVGLYVAVVLQISIDRGLHRVKPYVLLVLGRLLANRRKALQMLKRMKPELLYVHEHVALHFAGLYLSKFKESPPIVWDAHELYQAVRWITPWKRKSFLDDLESIQSSLSGFVTVNPLIGKEYLSSFPDLPRPHILSNAARKTDLVPYDGRLHLSAGLDRDHKVLLFQGGLSLYRGVEKLLDVSRELGPEWAVVFMGSGKLDEQIREVQSTGSQSPARGLVRLIPPVPHTELIHWTRGATLGALLYEPVNDNQRLCSPNKLWEYAAAGVPIIANELPFVEEVISKEGIGITVNPTATAGSIARSIKRLGPEELELMSQKARLFSNRENWEGEVLKLSSFLKTISAPSVH